MKNLKNLKGAKMLSKMEQKVVKGGSKECYLDGPDPLCPVGYWCVNGVCQQALP